MRSNRSTNAPRTPASHQGSESNNQPQPTALLIDAAEAQRLLGIGERTLWSLTKRDAIPAVRIGRRVLYRPGELEAWIAAGAPTEPGAADAVRVATGT